MFKVLWKHLKSSTVYNPTAGLFLVRLHFKYAIFRTLLRLPRFRIVSGTRTIDFYAIIKKKVIEQGRRTTLTSARQAPY